MSDPAIRVALVTLGVDDLTCAAAFYEAMGLNEKQIEIIRTAVKKRHYYLVSPEGQRLFDLGLGPIALAFAGSSSKEDIARVVQLERRHGERWPFAWLDEKGVDHDALQRP